MKMMHNRSTTIICLLAFISLLTAGPGNTAQIAQANAGFSMSTGDKSRSITFNIPEYSIQEEFHLGSQFHRIVIDGAGSMANIDEPDLPSFSTFYAVDPAKQYEVSIDILESEMHQNIHVFPKTTWKDEDSDPATPLSKKASVYNSAKPIPEKMATISNRMVLRDLHIVSVTVTPFRYNSLTQELEIVTSAIIELTENSTANNSSGTRRKPSRAFENLYRSFVVNYQRSSMEFQKPSILYILPPNTSSIQSIINVLLDWRREQGFEVNTASTSDIGTSSGSIKNYIETAYTNWDNPPEYVVLVGDADGTYSIATHFEQWSNYSGEGDHPYSTLEGDDFLPELLIGRLSFSNTTELTTIVNKILKYEKTPYMGEEWFTRASLVGDISPSGISCVTTNEYIRQVLEGHGFDDVRTIYSGSHDTQLIADINDGVAYANYRGWIGMSGFDTGDINNLNNGLMLPFATFLTCGTGSFASSSPTVVEAMIRAGTPSQPKGGVAGVGTATSGTHTMFNNVMNMGMYSGIFIDGIRSAGGALMAGKLNLWTQYPSDPSNYTRIFSHWNNLMGDPSLHLWTGTPQIMDVSYNATIKIGTNFFDVLVEDELHNPLEGARVVLYRVDSMQEIGYTKSDGFVTISLDELTAGDVTMTILKDGYVPHQGNLSVVNPTKNLTIDLDNVTVIDDGSGTSSGNGNGQLNGGEIIEISAQVSNIGAVSVSNVYAILSSSNSSVSVLNDSVYFGTVETSAGPSSAGTFSIQLSGNVREEENLALRVTIFDNSGDEWETDLELRAAASNIEFGSVSIVDNNDGLINPGETVSLNVALKNTGSATAANVSGVLTTNSAILEILDNQGAWGSMAPSNNNISNTDNFSVSANNSVIPGSIVNLELAISTAGGLQSTVTFPVQIGIAGVTDPTGPDEYGYYIYDSGDWLYANAPTFDWIEIDSRYGGEGTTVALNDGGDNQDDVQVLTLPFTFRMYGQAYNQISVCSNGWVSMGATTLNSFRNYRLPGPGGPSPMIAVFWDDLVQSNGGLIYKWYDVDNHRYIIQWSGLRTFDKNDSETFQVILMDPAYSYTPTGDGEIRIQYKDFNNTSSGQYSWSQVHGNYATVGIEDQTGTIGIEYTFDNQYRLTAMPLQDSTAILITTRGSDILSKGDINFDKNIDIFDLLTLIDYIQSNNTNYINPYLADINGDGNVNYIDMVGLIKEVMNY
ncbi:MAG: C25 family cysteine peptidase [Candidatus Marinimicrobia bacterium]|nr:C25 family cysteine peptidase [Candidatus Neomarinimicrobiota bacterium]